MHDPPHVRRMLARIDVIGIVLLAVGLTAMQLFLERGERENWFDSSFIVLTACIALVALALLIGWELWIEEPVVNLRVLRNIPFAAGTCLGFIFGITLFGSIFILPLFLQRLARLFGARLRAAAAAPLADYVCLYPCGRTSVQPGGQSLVDWWRRRHDDGGILATGAA